MARTEIGCSNPSFQVLLGGMEPKSYISPDLSQSFPGVAACPNNSGGKMSRYSTPTEWAQHRLHPGGREPLAVHWESPGIN